MDKSEPFQIVIDDLYTVLRVEGVLCSVRMMKELFNSPPSASLLNIRREGDQLIFEKFNTAEAATEFFAR